MKTIQFSNCKGLSITGRVTGTVSSQGTLLYALFAMVRMSVVFSSFIICESAVAQNPSAIYKLRNLESRAATAENPFARKGEGGMTKSGMKGNPALKDFKMGTTETLLITDGPGMIRHIWCTITLSKAVDVRNIILRMFWENSDVPSVEVPLEDFFGIAHGAHTLFSSQLLSIQPSLGYNCDIPMPFNKHALITVTNESDTDIDWFFYQIDFTLGDKVAKDDGRFHACFNRENPTKYGHDYTILETKGAKGVYLGCVLGVRPLTDGWWGEGEFKIYLDSDRQHPTICGTGIEDYFGAAWGLRAHTTPYRGAPLVEKKYYSLFRFHITDPIYFKNSIKVNVQQMGLIHLDEAIKKYGDSLIYRRMDHPRRDSNRVFYLRMDDVCSVAYWYQFPLIKQRKQLISKVERGRNLYIH